MFLKERLRLAIGGRGIEKRRVVREIAAIRHKRRLDIFAHQSADCTPSRCGRARSPLASEPASSRPVDMRGACVPGATRAWSEKAASGNWPFNELMRSGLIFKLAA